MADNKKMVEAITSRDEDFALRLRNLGAYAGGYGQAL